jgi:hypothetical protein
MKIFYNTWYRFVAADSLDELSHGLCRPDAVGAAGAVGECLADHFIADVSPVGIRQLQAGGPNPCSHGGRIEAAVIFSAGETGPAVQDPPRLCGQALLGVGVGGLAARLVFCAVGPLDLHADRMPTSLPGAPHFY